MKTKISKSFQTVVPREIRTMLSLRPGDSLLWEERDGAVVVRPMEQSLEESASKVLVEVDSEESKKKARRKEPCSSRNIPACEEVFRHLALRYLAKMHHLKEWWEIVGILEETMEDDLSYEVYIRCHDALYRLMYPPNSKEAEILREKLKGRKGRVIGILRTDLENKPVAVRLEEKH
jgi:AbrB family looped-hinge helix DNA binding protein